jgi:hypothetical protein
MKLFYIVSKKLSKTKFRGMAIYPFVVMNNESLKSNKTFIHHEKIHIKQQLELLIIPFFILYGLEFLFRLIQYRSAMKAYWNISFEREAYSNQKNKDYLKERNPYSFFKYLLKR